MTSLFYAARSLLALLVIMLLGAGLCQAAQPKILEQISAESYVLHAGEVLRPILDLVIRAEESITIDGNIFAGQTLDGKGVSITLIAGTTITLNGEVQAGTGRSGNPASIDGCNGGSITLDAPLIVVSQPIISGQSGGGGADGDEGTDGGNAIARGAIVTKSGAPVLLASGNGGNAGAGGLYSDDSRRAGDGGDGGNAGNAIATDPYVQHRENLGIIPLAGIDKTGRRGIDGLRGAPGAHARGGRGGDGGVGGDAGFSMIGGTEAVPETVGMPRQARARTGTMARTPVIPTRTQVSPRPAVTAEPGGNRVSHSAAMEVRPGVAAWATHGAVTAPAEMGAMRQTVRRGLAETAAMATARAWAGVPEVKTMSSAALVE